jgi:hypothetical protein
MATRLRRGALSRRVWPAVLVVSALLAAGCSEQGSAQRLPADSPILIEVSQGYVTVQNKAGLALSDVSISIVTYTPVDYSKRMPRMENMEKRQISLGDFHSPDGTPYNAGFIRAKSLRLRAKDTVGKSYEIEVPWS